MLLWMFNVKLRKFKIEIEHFCNNEKDFTITFDKLNASLPNKNINFWKKKKKKNFLTPNFWTVV